MSAPNKRSRRKRVLILLLVSPVFLLLLFPFFERLRGHIALTRFKRHLASRGVKLTVAEFKSSSPKGENGAPEFFDGVQQLHPGSVLPKSPPPRMLLMPSGRAIIGFREDEWVEDKTTNRWTELVSDLEQNEPTLGRIRAALEKPTFDNHVDLAASPNIKMTQLIPPKTTTQWLGAEAQLSLRQEHNKEALENLIAESRLTHVLAEDHILISELVRIAIAAIARTSVWEALQSDGWNDADLAKLAETWQSITFRTNMVRSLEGELIFGINAFNSMRRSNSNAVDSIYGIQKFLPPEESDRPWWERTMRVLPGGEKCADFFKEQLYCRLWRFAWLDQDELQYLRFIEGLLDVAHRPESEKSLAAIEPSLEQLLEPATHTSFYDNLRHPQATSYGALANSLKRSMKAEAERSLVLAAIALKRSSLRFGKLPASLQSLVPDFLPSVPTDYMDGQPIKYRVEPDGAFVLYSVGDDCKDDGGDTNLQPGKTSTRNWWYRKDVVWPQPALPDEIEKFRQEKAAGK
jgi:hypothetical protein